MRERFAETRQADLPCRRPGLALLVGLLLAVAGTAAALPSAELRIVVSRPDTSVTLPHHPLVEGSVLLLAGDDTLRSPEDYRLDTTRGLLRLSLPDSASLLAQIPLTLTLRYRHLPVQLPDSAGGLRPPPPMRLDTLMARAEPFGLSASRLPSGGLLARPGLRSEGHILRGVTVGSGRDLALESGLRLSLSGELAPDVEVRALLDDRSLPLQPEGTSARLSEIDQLYLDLRAGPARGRFGDYRLQLDAGRYGRIDRRLEGGMVAAGGAGGELLLAGAVTRARAHSQRFVGRDGVQGPYRMRGEQGEEELLVIGGSERVWVDGQRMQRGLNGDYTIDYSSGEITFTPARTITRESRIEVDFEYSSETYPRNLYGGQASWASEDGGLRATFALLHEADDAERPLLFDLSPSMREALQQAGPGEGAVYLPAAEELGPGEGDYVRIDSSWAVDGQSYTIFRFVDPAPDGSPRGNWRVPFSERGPGLGDYQRSYDVAIGNYRFDWVGPGNGDYVAARRVGRPEGQLNTALSLAAAPSERIEISAELGLSDYDSNLLSSRGDEQSVGLAQNYSLKLSPLGGDSTSSPLELHAHWRERGSHFREAERSRGVEYERRWALDSTALRLRERELGAEVASRPLPGIEFASSAGRLEQGKEGSEGHFLSERVDARARLRRGGNGAQLLWERIESEGRGSLSGWQRLRGDGELSLSLWRPGLRVEAEQRDERSLDPGSAAYGGHRYGMGELRLGIEPAQAAQSGQLRAELRAREAQRGAELYDPLYQGWAMGGAWRLHPATAPLRAELALEHRVTDFATPDSSDVNSDLVELRASATPLAGALSGDLHYRVNRTVTRASVLIAHRVPAGQGQYIQVGDEYVYDPEIGDVVLRPEPDGPALPTTDLAAALTLDWSPHRLPGGAGKQEGFGWEDISTSTQLELQEISRHPVPAEIVLLRLHAFQTDSTVQGLLRLRQELHLFRPSRIFNALLRYTAEERLTNLLLTGAERNGRDLWELRLRGRASRALDLETTASYERRRKRLARRASADAFTLRSAESFASWRILRGWRLTGRLRGLADRDERQSVDVLGLAVGPGLVWAVGQRGRISVDGELFWVETEASSIAWELAGGRPPGRNGRANLRADLALGEHVTGRAIYTLRLDAGRDPLHIARIEASAYF